MPLLERETALALLNSIQFFRDLLERVLHFVAGIETHACHHQHRPMALPQTSDGGRKWKEACGDSVIQVDLAECLSSVTYACGSCPKQFCSRFSVLRLLVEARLNSEDNAKNAPALLDLQNVTVMRGQKIVLENFSLRLRGDEHVAILGPNGCGKSTLIKTITRECYPVVQEGSSMTILEQERWDVFELRSLLGIVSNDLMSKCTGEACGRDVVLSDSSAALAFSPPLSTRSTDRWLMGLAQLQIMLAGVRLQMSSGEACRVLIARALVHKPRALLFDEPSNCSTYSPAIVPPDHEFAGKAVSGSFWLRTIFPT